MACVLLLYRDVNNRSQGFTIIELLVVMAIMGLLAILALSTVQGQLPKSRLNSTMGDVKMIMVRSRTDAVRNRRLQKVCMFADDDPTDAVDRGRILTFVCEVTGNGGCASTTICNNVDATSGALFTAGDVDVGGSASACMAFTTQDKWCLLENLDLSVGGRALDDVSIDGFETFANVDSGRSGVEITYNIQGAVSLGRSTPGMTTGKVVFSNYNLCDPGYSGGTFSCTSNIRLRFAYTAGGACQTDLRQK